ncbi:MAG: MFS transporter [Lentisphaeria bacterium]|nr:MFS transporter [Lentisphaeria bacterium]
MMNFSIAYRQLGALLGAHFFADLVSGILAGFLPAVLTYFNLELSLGVVLITSLGLGSNFLQVPAAKIARDKTGPAALIAGLILCAAFVVLALMPRSTPLWGLCLIMLLVGFGIALVHPQGVRGVQSLTELPASLTTPVFMIGGFLGYAVSPFLGGLLVGYFGMKGLLWLLPVPAAVIAAVYWSKVRFVPDSQGKKAAAVDMAATAWTFRRIWFIGLFLNTGTVIFSSLLPTMLHRQGFSLGFGGFSAMLFGLGSACGSMGIGLIARRFRPEKLIVWGLCAGIPAGCVYLFCCGVPAACVILFLAGVGAAAGFPQLVALTQTVPSKFALSTRIGMIVGWTWGMAGVLFLGMGVIAERFGVKTALWFGLVSYSAALLLAASGKMKK